MLQHVPSLFTPQIILPSPGTAQDGRFDNLKRISQGVIFQNGQLLWGRREHEMLRTWASSARLVVADLCWLRELTVNNWLRLRLHAPIRELGTITAQSFPSHMTLYDLLWYLGPEGRWGYSKGWREADDVFRELTNTPLHDYFNLHFRPLIPGVMAFENHDDGTPRFMSSAYWAGIWGEMMVRNGFSLDPVLWKLMQTPATFHLEGMGGCHLIRGYEAWELNLPGVPNGFMARDGSADEDRGHGIVACFPAEGVVVAVRGGNPEKYLPEVWRILRGQI